MGNKNSNASSISSPLGSPSIKDSSEALVSSHEVIFICDACGTDFPKDCLRYFCFECSNEQDSFDLCEKCAKKGHPHPLRECPSYS